MHCNDCTESDLNRMLVRLHNAIRNQTSRKWQLRLWSKFIRSRDAYRCVLCAIDNEVAPQASLAAHHIFRRCVLPDAEFDTGNGITLCAVCHASIHSVFNGRPVPNEPLNKREGDDQESIAMLYHAIEKDGLRRGILCEEFYFISDEVLGKFKQLQGFEETDRLSGSRISQAHRIWQMGSIPHYTHLASMVGHELLVSFQARR